MEEPHGDKPPQKPDAKPDAKPGGPKPDGGKADPKMPSRRRPALSFVVLFLLMAFGLLTAGRFAVNTPVMDWYLFQVAKHTAAVLNGIGRSCQLENPSFHKGREAAIRQSLRAWKEDREPAPGTIAESGDNAPPLTAWETWQYRALQYRRNVAEEEACLDYVTDGWTGGEGNGLDTLNLALSCLEASATRTRADGSTITVATPGVVDFVKTGKEALATAPGEQDIPGMLAKARELRTQQRKYLAERLARLQQREGRMGPLVTFEGYSLNGGEEKSKGDSFRFSVIPDCGALPSMSIFIAAVLAFPVAFKRRVAGVLLGIPVLYVVNILRLACLAYIGAWTGGGKWFEFAHEYVWQGIYLVFVVGVWLLWAEFIGRRGANGG